MKNIDQDPISPLAAVAKIRRHAVMQFIYLGCFISFVGFGAVFMAYRANGFNPAMVVQLTLLGSVWIIFAFRHRIPTPALAILALFMILSLATANLFQFGLYANSAFLGVLPALAFVLLGQLRALPC